MSKNTRKLWAGINDIINTKTAKIKSPDWIEEVINNETKETKNITDPTEIVDNYFTADEI